jgi:predicted  nucleic acid-binding Zn-ribbon protein
MSELGFRLDQEFAKLKRRRDELRVQLDLGKKEVEDKWGSLDDQWGELESKVKLWARLTRQTADEVSDAAEEVVEEAREGLETTADEVADAAKKLVAEVREGFERLKNLL